MPVEYAADNADECLVPVRTNGMTIPIFISHGLQCDPMFAILLGRHADEHLSIYALQGQGLDGTSLPLRRIEDIAARFIWAVRRVQPSGPYVLAGFCAGGHVAVEMAHQLIARGDEVAHLVLIDTPGSASLDERDGYIAQAIAVAARRLIRSEIARRKMIGGPATVAAFGEALRAYKRKPYGGRVHLLASAERAQGMQCPERGWVNFVPHDTPLRIIAPSHDAIIQQGLPAIALCLREWLIGAKADRGSARTLRMNQAIIQPPTL